MKKSLLFAIIICWFVSVSFAAVIIDENFETGTDGQSFPGWFFPSRNQIITGSGIDGKSLMIYNGNPSLGDWGVRSPDFGPTYCLIEFDMMIDTPCVYTSDGDGGNPEVMVFYNDGSISVGTPSGLIATPATWTANEAFRLGVLSLEDEVTFYINGVEIKHITRASQHSNIPVESFFFTYGSGGTASPGTIMIDNVRIIPEPMTLALLAVGGLLIRRRSVS